MTGLLLYVYVDDLHEEGTSETLQYLALPLRQVMLCGAYCSNSYLPIVFAKNAVCFGRKVRTPGVVVVARLEDAGGSLPRLAAHGAAAFSAGQHHG